MTEVSQMTQQRIGQPLERANNTKDAQAESRRSEQVRQLLAQPLTADDAVRIALLNNPALQADLAELGVAEADLVQAGRLRNPGISFGRLERTGGGAEIERGIMFDLAGLLTMPMRTQIERGRFEQARVRAAASAVTLAADVRRAYFSAVAARQTAQFMARAQQAAEAGAELAQRMQQVGNWNRLDTAREQMFYADATAALARSQHEERVTRERLIRLLGLWQSDVTLSLPDTLPALPSTPRDAIDLEKLALENRLDIQLAKQATASTAQALGLNKTTRFINVLDLGYRNKSETGAPRRDGYEISLELPLFDWGTARVAKAEALYMQALNRTADTAIRARSQVRESYSAYRTNYDLSRHYRDEVVPLRKKISEEMQLRYNGMLASVFDLLADACRQIDAVNAAINAQRDFWLAETDLQAAINGAGSPTDVSTNANRAVATNATNNEH
ncbi:TolC family protein [uncultured Oxalicibacterium sp.]|uniref:TolC family protein n=1 Tax=uncultured Oxalicibacterium sp. TaxID=1168540 RepID=UPI0025FDADED|nr:TolC family protein [uncultured Oxalicibacterium sp.]